MALAATHLRFALDLADRYPVVSLKRYIAGTIYPDSRWLTGQDRNATHGSHTLQKEFPTTDYTFGWHVHCICDHVQARRYADLFPGLTGMDREHRWILLSAAKMVQDLNDLQRFDVNTALSFLEYAENPENEVIAQVQKFNTIIQETYSGRDAHDPPDYHRLWVQVGLTAEMAAKLVAAADNIRADASLVASIEAVYPRMVTDARSYQPDTHPGRV